ncbi:hypothetical protein M0805_003848 [Coniferiporia weirii]|nr:hypothetical protein M0805_003848 [Coniferiporia weirii]
MDLKYSLGTNILALRACYNEDGADLLAVAGEDSVQVLQCNPNKIRLLAFFTIGLRVTAIAWSPRTISPAASDDWHLELAISTHDFGLHILSKSSHSKEVVFHFGGGLTGHHGRINDITFVGGYDSDARHIASVSDDRNLIVWDLCPTTGADRGQEPDGTLFLSPNLAPHQPTALVIPFTYPLCSVSSHATTSKEFLLSDSRGSVFLINWRKDPNEGDEETFNQQSIIELVHPRVLSEASSNTPKYLSGYASWRRDDVNIIGSVFGSEFALWDTSILNGGKPFATGTTFSEGGRKIRWCPSFPEYFAISAISVTPKGAVINVNNMDHLQSQAASIEIATRPHHVTDFDWLATRGTPRLAVAVERDVYVFPISVD